MRHLTRREAAKLLTAAAVAAALQGHTPYAQWTVYRRRNLFIVASRADERATALAEAVAKGFAAELSDSHARFTRATDTVRVASLLRTGQLEVAVIARQETAGMTAGTGPYAAVGPVALRLLAELGDHLLVTVADFKTRHAYLLAQALDRIREPLALPRQTAMDSTITPYHPGALAYRRGEPVPADERGTQMEPARPHAHLH